MRKEIKFLLKFILFVPALAAAGQAQDSKATAEILQSSEKIIKGAPFSAEVITESVQVLADGNKITRKITTRMYRDSEGRFRRDELPNPGGVLGSVIEFPQTLFIIDPVTGAKFYVNPSSKTARRQPLKTDIDLRAEMEAEKTEDIVKQQKQQDDREKQRAELEAKKIEDITKRQKERDDQEKQRAELEVKKIEEITRLQKQQDDQEKQRAELETKKIEDITRQQKREDEMQVIKDEEIARQAGIIPKQTAPNAVQTARQQNPAQKDNPISPDNTKTESLGVKSIEGIQVEGTRTTSTIATGKIGNEKAIDIIYERWYSKDLHLIILSKHSDPRFGEQTYRLINISRSEPDRSLFSLPAGYKIVNQLPSSSSPPPKTTVPRKE